jgi:hypothetical protein
MNKIYKKFFLILIIVVSARSVSFSQVNYNDGPIRLRVWIHKVWSSANCGDIGDQEYVMKDLRARVSNTSGGYITSPSGLNLSFWGNENRYYDMGQMHQANIPFGVFLDPNGYKLLDVPYGGTQVPSQFDVYIGNAFENDCYGDALSCGQGSEMSYEGCCCLFGVCALGDDYLYTGTGWTTVNFRPGPEGQVNYTQPIVYNRSGDEHAYSIVYAYEWDWTGNVKPLCPSPNYKDGPITLTADLVGVFSDLDWDGGTCGIAVGGNEDLRVKILAKDNLTSYGNFPTGSSMHISQDVPKWNGVFSNVLTKNYTTADINMQAFEIAADLWEEDSYDYGSVFGFGLNCGSDNDYEGSDYGFPWLCINGDDGHYVSRVGAPGTSVFTIPTYGTINWRSSPPNTFNTVDVPARIGSGSFQNWILRFRYKWTISTPTVSIPTVDLQGCIGSSIPLTATTTNATYFKWQYADATTASAGTCPAGGTWTDVPGEYCSSINFPQVAGTRVYRLIVYNRNGSGSTTSSGPKYDSAVSNCVRVTYFPFAPAIISTACGRSVPSGGAISFSVPLPPAPNAIADGLPGWSYSWSISPTSNVSPTSGTGTTFSPVFTSAAAGTTYTVTLTVTDPCGATDSKSFCTFNVTTPSCDQIYVAPSAFGGNDVNAGTASSPYATIQNALANVGGSRVHIHIMGGASYTNETQWQIPSNAIIDGGWEIVSLANNDWRKNSSLTTSVTIKPGPVPENDGSQGFYRGIISNGNGWLMQDLNISVAPNISTPQFNGKGLTVYGIYDNGHTGWEIKRTTIHTSNGTNGANGTTPGGSGGAGGGATSGGGGGQGSLVECYGGGTPNCPSGGCQGEAYNGGGGGSGSANNGTAGSGGGGGNWATGGDCNLVGCDANGATGGWGANAPDYGQAGGPGIGSPNYSAGSPGTPGLSSPYYQPGGQSGSGGKGGGGGRGGGGGGGDVGTCCLSCPFAGCGWSRPNGGNGGIGGNGGLGGGGGYGGGGSFGGYFVSSTGTISQSSINSGAGGSGGTGALGQPGSNGQPGGAGVYSGGCDGNGSGGNGGKGGNGAPGGRGQDGANGYSLGVATIGSSVSQPGGSPSGPNAFADYLKARYLKGCTNSLIEIEKNNGSSPPSPAFDLAAMGASIINDIAPDLSTYTNNTGALVTQVQFPTTGWKQEKLSGQTGWTTFIRILESRSKPTIVTTPKRVCSAENIQFTITGNNPNQDYSNTANDYEWRYRIYKNGTVRAGFSGWTGTGTGAGPNTINVANFTSDSITVLIAARVRDKCCGWSVWIFDSVVVFPDINPASCWTSTPPSGTNICLKGAPATMSVDIPTCQSGGIVGSSYFIYRYTTDGGVTWTPWSQTRPTAIPKIIGSTIVQNAYVSPLSPDNCDTALSSLTINWTVNDSVQAIAGVVDVAACGTPNSSAIISAAAPAIGSGIWTQVSGSSNSTPPTPTSTLMLTINNVPFNSTNDVYRWTVTNGACSDQVDVTIATPNIVANAITMQSDACYVCPISDGQTYNFYDYAGKIIMTIKDNSPPTSELGSTEVCTHIHPFVQETWTVAYPDLQPYLQRYWTISPAQNTDATVTLYFTSAEYNALKFKAMTGAYAFNGLSDLRVSKFPGGGGGAFTPIHSPGGIMMPGLGTGLPNPVWATWSGNGTDYQVTFDCNSYSTFYIHPVRFPYEVLPVELISFTGTNMGDKNRLEWITASEDNTEKFIVEKSLDVNNWFYVGEKPAAGNSSARLTYELFDNFPVTGDNYYRLKIIDKDGTFKYSHIINIPIANSNVNGIVGIYPNPTSSDIVLVISSASTQNASVKVYDVLGKLIKAVGIDLVQGINKPLINLNNLANGTYIISFTDSKGYEHQSKIIKQ